MTAATSATDRAAAFYEAYRGTSGIRSDSGDGRPAEPHLAWASLDKPAAESQVDATTRVRVSGYF